MVHSRRQEILFVNAVNNFISWMKKLGIWLELLSIINNMKIYSRKLRKLYL